MKKKKKYKPRTQVKMNTGSRPHKTKKDKTEKPKYPYSPYDAGESFF